MIEKRAGTRDLAAAEVVENSPWHLDLDAAATSSSLDLTEREYAVHTHELGRGAARRNERGDEPGPAVSRRQRALRPIAAEQVVCRDPLLGEDRPAERELAAQHRGRDDLGQLANLPGSVAT